MVEAERSNSTKLEVSFQINGKEERHLFDSGEVRIGRRRDCDLVIDNNSISRHHATVSFEGGRWILRDNSSVNGLRLRGRTIFEHALGDDRIAMGDIIVDFHVDLPVELDAKVRHREQTMSTAIEVRNLDGLFKTILEEDGAKTSFGQTPPTTIGAAEIIQLMRLATDSLLSNDDLDTTLKTVLDLVFQHLPANQASVMLFDEDQKTLVPRLQRTADGGRASDLRMSRHIANAAITTQQAVLVTDAEEDPRFNAAASIVSQGIRSAICAPLCHRGKVGGLIYVDRRSRNMFSRSHLEVLCILASLSAAAVERAQLQTAVDHEREIRERLSRYNAPAVIDRIIQADTIEASGMAAEEREVSVLFADIAGFTNLSENQPARAITELLNEVFQALTEEVFEHGGTLDKFIGDAVMVFFGAPLDQPDHPQRAVRTGLAMQRRIQEFNSQNPDGPQLGLRIGINTGSAVVGDIGALQRRDYTVVGDTVNTACRIESSVAEVGQVVIGCSTYEQVKDEFDCEPLPLTQVKGKQQPLQPYLVRG
ncbi:MAG: adenylate/guanylate cyclase domain-containing protein [Planctomycetota bacterium]|nr:adenylate/guanylate cyclase domain-containing protein [Planctomycetota bacterium]